MANVQLAVAGDDNTQVILSVPGVQGPAGSNLPPSGTTNQVLYKQSNTDYDTAWSFVTSAMIASGTIVNEDVNASAAIAGTKISPNFGSQNVVTTGTSTAASFIPTSSSVPTNGVYLPSANNVAISTNGTGRLFVTSDGKIGVAGTPFNPLDVFGSATLGIRYKSSGSYAGIVADNTSSTGGGFFGCHQNGTQKAIFGLTGAFLGDTSADAGVFAETGQAIRFFTNGSTSEKARITDDGKLGLGTSSPGVPFDLNYSNSSTYSATTDVVSSATFFNISATTNTYAALKLSTYGTGSGSNVGTVNLCALASSTQYGAEFTVQQRTTSGAFRENLRITHDGKVGIGTTAPNAPLDVVLGTTGTTAWFRKTGSPAAVALGTNTTPSALVEGLAGGGLVCYTGTGTIASPTWSEALRVDNNKRLLVGTSTATKTSSFNVQGNSASSSGEAVVRLQFGATSMGDGGTQGIIVFGDSNEGEGAYIYGARDGGTWGASSKPTRLVFSTAADGASSPTERMRIANSGEILSFSNSAGFLAKTSQPAGTSTTILAGVYGATSTQDGTISFRVWSNGDVVNTNNSYGAISDIKLKENIVDANSQWDDLKALQVRNYNLKEGQPHTQIGLIAQEVELVSPGLISESPDLDEEGNDLGTVTKSVNYSVLYMKAVKALQEAMERIETLEAKVAALEGV
jgi:hypothetical protein